MQERLLGGRVAAEEAPVRVQPGDPAGIQPAEPGVRRRDQQAVVEPDADVAGGAVGKAEAGQQRAVAGDLLAQPALAHGAHSNALMKKSGAPKLPDLSASASGGSPRLVVQGTPGSIGGPDAQALNAERADHRARGLAARDHQPAHALRPPGPGRSPPWRPRPRRRRARGRAAPAPWRPLRAAPTS